MPEGPDSRERLLLALRINHALRARERSLLARLRASIHEMQTQREQLRRDGLKPVAIPTGGARQDQVHQLLGAEYGMTAREIEVAVLLAQGCSNHTVAQRLGISPHTARHHTQRVLGKLGVHTRAQAGARLRGVAPS